MKQATNDLTIVITGSSVADWKTLYSSENLFFILPESGTDSADLRKAVARAIELSPTSEYLLVFTSADTPFLSQTDLRKIANRRADYLFRASLGCITLSKRYAMHIVSADVIPSLKGAITNGFYAPMSILQVIQSPRIAVKQYSTIVKFGIVGASGVAVNLIVLTLLKIAIPILAANVIAQELSIINNFIWNDRFTFRSAAMSNGLSEKSKLLRFVKYNLVSLLSLTVNEVVFYFVYYHLGVYYITSSLLAIAAAFVVNYFGSSRWAWTKAVSLSVKD
ncbi:MAG: GtrA family protein [Nitrososphaerales archaeon]